MGGLIDLSWPVPPFFGGFSCRAFVHLGGRVKNGWVGGWVGGWDVPPKSRMGGWVGRTLASSSIVLGTFIRSLRSSLGKFSSPWSSIAVRQTSMMEAWVGGWVGGWVGEGRGGSRWVGGRVGGWVEE